MARAHAWTAVVAGLTACLGMTASCSGVGGGGGVDLTCDSGFHQCGSECWPDDSIASCGGSCTPCPGAPAHGRATCSAGACGFACDAGYHACAGSCFDDASPAHCGAACAICEGPGIAHAVPACVAGACGYTCEFGFVACDAGCCGAPSAGLARLAAGGETTCGVDGAGVLECWGYNRNGAVGDGSTEWTRLAPVPVAGAHQARWVAVGGGHACAIDLAGEGWCWGSGGFGQLGDGTTFGVLVNQPSPVAVKELGGEASMVAAGLHHTCALLESGAVKCWGINEEGELGDGTLRTSTYPVTVSGVAAAGAVLSGDRFACALTGLAEMKCWGSNDAGQLGNAAAGAKEGAPVNVTNLAGVTRMRAVALGGRHVCVAYDGPAVSGGVRCWGAAPGNGRSEGSATGVVVTGPLAPIDGVVALDAGAEHTCAVTGSGGLLCWGRNADGQLGDGTLEDRPTAFPVSGLSSGVVGVSAGGRHTCALVDADGATALRCWGANFVGQLGDGTETRRTTPTPVPGF